MSEDRLSLRDEQEIDSICERFEAACGDGPLPDVDVFVATVDENMRSRLRAELEALREEFERRAAVPERVGGYRILGILGQGGMGTVYSAMQETTRQHVALKVIRPDAVSPRSRRRFEREVRLLGQLQHPGIAQLFDAGLDDRDPERPRPYLAMELLDGRTLLDYAEHNRLDVRQRLEIVRRVCLAVQHAHDHGIVHRDLKPANVLVVEPGSSTSHDEPIGLPKVVDFGVARAIGYDDDLQNTLATHTSQIVGTISHMSPEQLEGDADRVDGRTDVWALGVILYQLLAGRLPFDIDHRSLPAAIDSIRDADPVPLGQQDGRLRGDVEVIVHKALEKDRERRYATAAELAQDLRRFLDSKPIQARPPSVVYRTRKLVRRHRALTTSLVVILVALTTATVISIGRAREEAKARLAAEASEREANRALAEARRQQRRSEAMHDFLLDVLKSPDARSGNSPDLKVVDALDVARRSVEAHFRGDPALAASARVAIADTLASLTQYDAARSLLDEAVAEVEGGETGEQLRVLAEALLVGADMAVLEGRFDDVEVPLRRVDRIAAQLEDPALREHQAAATLARVHLALQRGQIPESAQLIETLAERLKRTPGVSRIHIGLEQARVYLALAQGDLPTAETILKRQLELLEQRFGGDHPDMVAVLAGLGAVCHKQNRAVDSAAYLRRSIEIGRRYKGDSHPAIGMQLQNLGVILRQTGQLDEAARAYDEALAILLAAFDEQHPMVINLRNNLARLAEARGELGDAIEQYRKVVEAQKAALQGDHLVTAQMIYNLAHALTQRGAKGDLDVAAELHDEALQMRIRLVGEIDSVVASSSYGMALLQEARGDFELAHETWLRTVKLRRQTSPDLHIDVNLAAALEALGLSEARRKDAAAAKAAYREARQIYDAAQPRDAAAVARLDALLGQLDG